MCQKSRVEAQDQEPEIYRVPTREGGGGQSHEGNDLHAVVGTRFSSVSQLASRHAPLSLCQQIMYRLYAYGHSMQRPASPLSHRGMSAVLAAHQNNSRGPATTPPAAMAPKFR
eukprot:791222-Rhodomonas_salina.3